jgi:hypothetical protein
MKKLIILIIWMSLTKDLHSQTIYSEDFSDDWKKGATTYGGVSAAQPTDGNWSWVVVGTPSINGGSATSWNDMSFMDGASVMSTNGSNSSTLAFRWNDVNDGSTTNRVDWYSKEVLGNYTAMSLSVDYGIGNGSSANSVYAYYIIDGGIPVLFGSKVNQTSATGTFTISSLTCSSSIQIYVKAITRNSNSSYVLIDNVIITGSTALPIELIYFKGKSINDGNLLEWETASETNNDYFTIYRSGYPIDWHPIAKIDGVGTSPFNHYYRYVDTDPLNEIGYYYISQTDFDARFKNFHIISIDNRRIVPELIRITNILGQDITMDTPGVKILHYSDGTIVKLF